MINFPFSRRILLLVLLFIFSFAIPSFVLLKTQTTAIAQIQPGKTSYQSGNFELAVEELLAAIAKFAAKGDQISQAVALRNLSLVYQQLGQWKNASQAISQSLAILRSGSKTNAEIKLLAEALDVQGLLLRETGNAEDAQAAWKQATELYRKVGDKLAFSQGLIHQAIALQDLGFYPQACNTLRSALSLNQQRRRTESRRQQCSLSNEELQTLKNLPASDVNVVGLRSLGDILQAIGELKQSRSVLEFSLEAAKKLQLPQDVAAAYLSLGNNARLMAIKRQFEEDNQFQKEALDAYKAAENSSDPIQRVQAKLNLFSLFIEIGGAGKQRVVETRHVETRHVTSLRGELQSLRPTRSSLYAQLNFAQNLLKLAASQPKIYTSEIEEVLTLALKQAEALGDTKSQAYVLGSWGRLYELKQQRSLSETVTIKALSLVSSSTAPQIAYQLFWQLGRIYKVQGNLKKATANYVQAVNILADLRSDLVTINPDIQFSFRSSVEPVYRELVSLLLTQPSQENLKQARQVIESLQLAELDNFFQDACAQAKPKQIDEVDSTAAVFYPIILSDRLETILSIPGQPLRHYAIEKSQTEIEEFLETARNSLRQTAFAQERLPLAQKLYDWLVRPAQMDLANNNIKTLVFVLDGTLRNFPMASLHDGQQYLIEKYNIALAPGLQLLEPLPLPRERLKALVGGISKANQGLPALPAVTNEVQQISSEFKTQILLNQDLTRSKLQDAIRTVPFPVVHLATHGQFSSNADDTFILIWDDRINANQLDQLLRLRKQGSRPIELLVLSACETALGDNLAALGMAGVAIRSGARATIATLWQVNDQSTAIFMTQFYKELSKPGVTKASALRNAQLALLRKPNYQSPYFWAPFVLIGNW